MISEVLAGWKNPVLEFDNTGYTSDAAKTLRFLGLQSLEVYHRSPNDGCM